MEKKLQKIYLKIYLTIYFIDSTRFMARSLSNLVNNLSEGIHRIKCKFGHNNKNVKLVELNIDIVTVFLHIKTLTMIE